MRYVFAILALLTLCVGANTALAQDGRRARQGVEAGEVQSLDRILSGIRQQFPGRLSDVDGPEDGRYRIKWLTPDGRVLMFDTDARTGRVLGVEGDIAPPRRDPRVQSQRSGSPSGERRRGRRRDDDDNFQDDDNGGTPFFGGGRRNRYR